MLFNVRTGEGSGLQPNPPQIVASNGPIRYPAADVGMSSLALIFAKGELTVGVVVLRKLEAKKNLFVYVGGIAITAIWNPDLRFTVISPNLLNLVDLDYRLFLRHNVPVMRAWANMSLISPDTPFRRRVDIAPTQGADVVLGSDFFRSELPISLRATLANCSATE